MKINYIKVKNWKNFISHKIDFENMNIINYPNGWGKSSIFEAIIYALYAKRPSGLAFSDLKNDPNKESYIEIEFIYKNNENRNNIVKIIRKFGKSSSSILYLNDEMISNSPSSIFNFINNIIPYNIISVLWSEDSLKSSKILKPDFMINEVFDYIFKDPKIIEKYYKSNIFSINKELKQLESNLNINIKKDIEETDNLILEIQNKIKGESINKSLYNKALIVKESVEKLKEYKKDPIDIENIQKWESIVKGREINDILMSLNIKLNEEKNKVIESPLSKIDKNTLLYIVEESEKIGKSIITNDPWKKSYSDNIKNIIQKGIIDLNLIKRIELTIELIKKYNYEEINYSKEYWELYNISKSLENYQNILDLYNEETNLLWDKLNELNNKRNMLERQNHIFENYTNLKSKLEKEKSKLSIIIEYIQNASEYFSNNITEKASEILNKLNSRYDYLFLEDGKYQVTVLGYDMETIGLSNVLKLSSGEKTLVGISLILAAHELFFPNIPLLFDESFSALDKENVTSLKDLFKNNNFQTFIITHDKYWLE